MFLVNQLKQSVLMHEAVTSSEQSQPFDTANIELNVLITISVQAGGTGTSVPVIQHSEDGQSNWAAPDADAVVNARTAEPTTLANLTTAASVQTIGLRKDLLKRYIRVAFSGGTSHQVAVVASGVKKYSEVA